MIEIIAKPCHIIVDFFIAPQIRFRLKFLVRENGETLCIWFLLQKDDRVLCKIAENKIPCNQIGFKNQL